MTTGKLISQDEKLHRAISKVLTDVVIGQSASINDITSGLYKPINKIASLINIEKLSATQQKIATLTVEEKKLLRRTTK
jgi:hypothetical protein